MEPVDDRGRTVTIVPQSALEPPNNKLHPEWPPRTIVEWINNGCVSHVRLIAELEEWLDYFKLPVEEWTARWYLQEQ